MKNNRLTVLLAAASAFALILTGCGNAQASPASASKTKIVIATSGSPNPFSYVDENKNITGYDVEIVKAVMGKLPQYEYSIETADFGAIFGGLDSDRYQIGVNNFSYNKERAEKYLYSTPIFKDAYVVAVAKNNTDINSFQDLPGKTTEVDANTAYATALQDYNSQHKEKPINIQYYSDVDLVEILRHVTDGKADFQLIDEPMYENYMKEYSLDLKSVKLSDEESNLIATPYSYILTAKSQPKLSEDINAVLPELVKDKTIEKISEKFFNGSDYTPYDKY